MNKRRVNKHSAAGLLVVSLALPVLPLTAAHASAAPGSGFASVSVSALAKGQEFLFRQEIPAQLSVPYALSELKLGDGSATATVAWPGAIGATLGTTLILAGGAPDQVSVLNDPAVAYAQSGVKDSDNSVTVVPGSTMRATATKTKATAVAAAEGAQALATTAGSTKASSAVELTGPTTVAGTATTEVRDVTLGGVVHIGAVTSSAKGTTDGHKADATGSTSVTGVTVAGVGVTVDEKGVSVAGTGVVPPGALDAVTSALEQAQITLQITKPVRSVNGPKVEYATGALVAVTPLGTLTLGGAQLVLTATRADSAPPPSTVTVPGPVVEPPAAGQPVSGTPPQLSGSTPSVAGPPTQVQGPATLPSVATPGALSLLPVSIRTGYGWAWIASGLLLSFLASSALLALNRRWLAPDLSGCPLEGRLP